MTTDITTLLTTKEAAEHCGCHFTVFCRIAVANGIRPVAYGEDRRHLYTPEQAEKVKSLLGTQESIRLSKPKKSEAITPEIIDRARIAVAERLAAYEAGKRKPI